MGDRANIVIIEGEAPPLFLYTHCSGWELGETLATALDSPAGRGRWSDSAYLTRIIFCQLVKGHETGETGFGIATSPPDNSYAYLVVDVTGQKVRMVTPGIGDFVTPAIHDQVTLEWSFADVALDPEWFGETWQAVAGANVIPERKVKA